MALIRLENVTVRFGDTVALDGVELLIRHGETMAVLGPSGCGKTTLLKAIAGLIRPAAGHIYFDDHPVDDVPPRGRGIGMVFEGFALYPHLDARENIAFPLHVRKEVDIETRVQATVRRLGIDRQLLLERRPPTLAAGEQQLVALGRALVADPTVLLLDEPLGSLDAHTRARTRAQLGRLMDDFGITAVYVTHDQQEAIALATRVAVMRAGQIVQVGTSGELRQRPANVFVAQFVGSPAMNILPARVEAEQLWIEGATAPVALPAVRTRLTDGPLLAGVRPEHLSLDPGGVWTMQVTHVEPLLTRRSQLVHGEVGGRSMVAEVPADIDCRAGPVATLSADSHNIHLFSLRDEARIR